MHTCVTPRHYYKPAPASAPAPSVSPGTAHEGSTGCSDRAAGGRTMKLYHQTGCDIGPKILASGFKLGSKGWCGGGIYFATSPKATETKAIGEDSHKGFMIEATVLVGAVGHADRRCKYDGHVKTNDNLFSMGYDSTTFNPGDGDEVIVYCSNQVISMQQIPWTGRC